MITYLFVLVLASVFVLSYYQNSLNLKSFWVNTLTVIPISWLFIHFMVFLTLILVRKSTMTLQCLGV